VRTLSITATRQPAANCHWTSNARRWIFLYHWHYRWHMTYWRVVGVYVNCIWHIYFITEWTERDFLYILSFYALLWVRYSWQSAGNPKFSLESDRAFSVTLTHITSKCTILQHTYLDEISFLLKGKVIFRQYIHKKHKRSGKRIHTLCDWTKLIT
jgi:hypothetical protein